jgi:hypothetical protein
VLGGLPAIGEDIVDRMMMRRLGENGMGDGPKPFRIYMFKGCGVFFLSIHLGTSWDFSPISRDQPGIETDVILVI